QNLKQILKLYKKFFDFISYDFLITAVFVISSSIILIKYPYIIIDRKILVSFIAVNIALIIAYLIFSIAGKRRILYKIVIILILIINFLFLNFQYLNYRKIDKLSLQDETLHTEIAIEYFLSGKNPYKENYFNTIFAEWHYTFNRFSQITPPPIYHYAYPPFSFIMPLPFYLVGQKLFDYYDQRWLYIILYLFSVFLLFKIPNKKNQKILLVSFFAFNPVILGHLFFGSNNIAVLFWIILTIYLLKKNRLLFSSISLAFAAGVKQSAWFILPFYFTYIFFKKDKNFIKTFKSVCPFFIVSIIIFLPFFIWDAYSLFDDILYFSSGKSVNSYPIGGIGLTGILVKFNIIKSPLSYFPCWIFQALFGLPLLVYLLKRQIKNNSVKVMLFNYSLFLFVVWFFSRYFYLDHFNYIMVILVIGCFTPNKFFYENKHYVSLL
ncbi:MAG: glycosyltransferase family 87 protein, partial [Patescibacteria group bacterium]|nr:glycosyltransferase family 87 protein [Patescibacteria group bacterium]